MIRATFVLRAIVDRMESRRRHHRELRPASPLADRQVRRPAAAKATARGADGGSGLFGAQPTQRCPQTGARCDGLSVNYI